MKKILLSTLVSLFAAVFAHAISDYPRTEYVTRVESCEAILQEFMANPATAIPASVLKSAKGLVIVNQFKAGLVFGIKDGYAVIMVKKPDGRWSLPVLLAAGELSLGFQVGANAVETIMVLTDDQTPRILFNHRFNVGVDAKAVAGPKMAEAEKYNREILRTPVLVYSRAKGLYAGATVKAGWLERSDKSNFVLYNTTYTMPELLYSDWVQPVPEVQPLMNLVNKLVP
jgi:lipid-binding SYLF domain-containing protein